MSENGDDLFISPESPVLITGFQIRDPQSRRIFFARGFGQEIGEAGPIAGKNPRLGIAYKLDPCFLQCQQIATQVQFQNISEEPIQGLLLIEEHKLNGKVLQEFRFDLCFAPPRTQNTWEHLYQPEFALDKKFKEKALAGDWEVHTKMFVGKDLVMHTMAKLTFRQ